MARLRAALVLPRNAERSKMPPEPTSLRFSALSPMRAEAVRGWPTGPRCRRHWPRSALGEAGGLITPKIDRLGRNAAEVLALVEQATKEGWRLIALDAGLDTDTPAGELVAGMLALAARFEHRRIAERQQEKFAELRRQRRARGQPATGRALADRIIRLRGVGRRGGPSPTRSTPRTCPPCGAARNGDRRRLEALPSPASSNSSLTAARYAGRVTSAHTRTEAAAILRRIADLLPVTSTLRAYLLGQADGLDPASTRRQS